MLAVHPRRGLAIDSPSNSSRSRTHRRGDSRGRLLVDPAPPCWRTEKRLFGSLPAGVRSWLLDDGSLTRRLIDTGREFSLQRWSQSWAPVALEERRRLRMGLRERAVIRQVVLRLDGEAVVFARSVFPADSLAGPLLTLRRLAKRSLGAFLFARADMRRSPFELARLAGDSPYLPAALHQAAPAWARRSCFQVAGKPLLVSEVFLRGFPRWRSPMPVHRSRRGRVSATIGR